jgi:ACS family tartrate transporter-like MFS transporter
LLAASTGLAACVYFQSFELVVLGLCLALVGGYGVKGPFWALVSDTVSPANKAASIAMINSIANISGFVAPFVLGFIKDRTGSFALGLLPMIVIALIAAAIVLLMGRRQTSGRRRTPGRTITPATFGTRV